jgi:2-polyprenyl-3-methyl-5-hydroxy-6-metoxy-1,4-benzoquinol methylase
VTVQSAAELDSHYSQPDPWGYNGNPHDTRRKAELLSVLPSRPPGRVLDIGCGDGFISFDLPGQHITGVDLSAAAIGWAQRRLAQLPPAEAARFQFEARSLFDLPQAGWAPFDTVLIADWNPPRFPYALLDTALYPYREYTHRIEVYRK